MLNLSYWEIYNFAWIGELLVVPYRTNVIDKFC